MSPAPRLRSIGIVVALSIYPSLSSLLKNVVFWRDASLRNHTHPKGELTVVANARAALASTERAPEPDASGLLACVTCGAPAAAPAPCIGNDPLCPCQDGDQCHYRGKDAWPVPAATPAGEPDMIEVCAALGFDPTNHHNAAKCPYCRPYAALAAPPVETLMDAQILDKWEDAQCDSSLHGTEERVLSFARALFHPTPHVLISPTALKGQP